MNHHPTSIIDPQAQLAADVQVGPFCVIGPQVRLGAGTKLLSHVVIQGDTHLGQNNTLHPFVCLGGIPQDLKYAGEPGRVRIGDNNVLREYTTVHIGTQAGGLQTTLGNHCLLMASAHVAHDCTLGNHVIMANSVALAGHVQIADRAALGGLAGVHQFCRVGTGAFVAAGSMVHLDIPPFCMAQGDRAQLTGLNAVGLTRAGMPKQALQKLRYTYQALMQCPGDLHPLARTLQQQTQGCAHSAQLLDFVLHSKRGICPPRRKLEPPHPRAA